MLIVSGTFELRRDRIDDARREFANMMSRTATEPGCLTYEFSAAVTDPTIFRLFEVWEGAVALRAHVDTPHFAAFSTAMHDLVAAAPVIHRYQVTDMAPMI